MASTYSTSLRLELIGTGDQSGTWGTTTNTNLGTLLEQAITGVSNVSMTSDADYTLTTVNGGTDQSRQAVLNITSTVSLTATRNIIIPSVNKIYIVKNGTSGSQSLTIKTSSGTGITVKNGYTTAVYCNGTNVYQAIDYLPSVTIDSVLFTDVLGVGSAALSNVNAYLNTDLSSSSTTQYGLLVNTTPSVSATSLQYGVLSSMQGATGSSGSPYTTDAVHGLRASAYVTGTYQTVTSQYGVSVANQSGTATFNYAFYANTSGSSSVSLSSISRASNVVSVATATSHGLAVGDTVVISSATSSFNGIFTVTTAGTTTTFQYNQTGSNETGTASQGYSTKANNWNYYSASSAPNYFNGPTIISASSGMEGLRITQAGSGNALVVEDSTNPDSSPFVVDASGAVGIGTSSPSVKLNVVGGATSGAIDDAAIFSGGVAGVSGSGSAIYLTGGGGVARAAAITGVNTSGASNAHAMVFSTSANSAAPTERMRIDSSGNVIVGNSTTDVITGLATPQFQVQGTTTGAAGLSVHASDTTSSGGWQSAKSRGTLSAPTIVNSGDNLGQIRFAGYDGSGFIRAAEINGQSDGTPGTNDMPGRLIFSTTADGASSPTERMRIDSSGNVGIGATSPTNKLTVNGGTASITNSTYAVLLNLNDTVANNVQFGTSASDGFYIANTANLPIRFSTNSTERMRIRSDGSVSIGGSGSAAVSLYIQKPTTGAVTAYGILAYGTVQNDVTASAHNIQSQSNIASGTAVTNYTHFRATEGTISGTVTNQIGFDAVSDLISATSNFGFRAQNLTGVTTGKTAYGFYSAVDTATGGGTTYGFYAAGTADNYFAGNVGIGTTSTLANSSLNVSQGVVARNSGATTGFFQLYNDTAGTDLKTWRIGNLSSGIIKFETVNDAYTVATERMRVDSSGNTYIETGTLWQYAPAPTAKSAAATLTAAELKTGIIVGTGTSYTLTMPTGTNIDAAFTGVPTTGIGFDFYVVSGASGTITMAVNTGVTNSGGLTIGTGQSAHFRLRRTAANTYVMYRLA